MLWTCVEYANLTGGLRPAERPPTLRSLPEPSRLKIDGAGRHLLNLLSGMSTIPTMPENACSGNANSCTPIEDESSHV
jgi:hypothetical protein